MNNDQQVNEDDASSISLRPFKVSDIDDYMIWASDERVPTFCSWEANASRQDGIDCIEKSMIPHPWFRAICINDRPIGYSLVTPDSEGRRRAEIGFVLAYRYWGKGIGTRAVKLVTLTVFGEWPDLERLEALVDVDNLGSQRVLQKAGFVKEGVLRKYLVIKGRSRDFVSFSILSTDLSPYDSSFPLVG